MDKLYLLCFATCYFLCSCASESRMPLPSPTLNPEITQEISNPPTSTTIHTQTPDPSPSPTTTDAPTATITPAPTATPVPQANLSSFVFPYDVPQILSLWEEYPSIDRHIIYHITHRPELADPCGRHPGDIIIPITSGINLSGFSMDVLAPYSGELVKTWLDWRGEECLTLDIGYASNQKYHIDMYHTNTNTLARGGTIFGGNIIGALTNTYNNGGIEEAKVHLTLYAGSELSDPLNENLAPGAVDLFPYAIGPTLRAMYDANVQLLIRYEGANYCNMNSQQKIEAILTLLVEAGFCVDGSTVTYCGSQDTFQGLSFRQSAYDQRTILLRPTR